MRMIKYLLLMCNITLTQITIAQKLEINIIQQPPIYEKDTIDIEIYLINNTDTTLTYFDSRGPSWDESFKEIWDLSRDYQFVEILPLNNAFDYKFTDSTIITLSSGDTNLIRTKALVCEYAGSYSFTYTQEHAEKFVKKEHADQKVTDSLISTINTFKVSENIEFEVYINYDTTIYKVNDMSWDEWKDFRHTKVYTRDKFYDNIYAALKHPQDVYKLLIWCNGMDAESIMRIGRLKNLKSLTLNNYELDFFPKELTQLDLYELTILPKNEDTVIKFNQGFSKNHTIRELRVIFNDGLPDSVINLKQLEMLDISESKIGKLQRLDSLKNLEVLVANNASISTLENAGFDNMPKLKSVNFSGNKKLNTIEPLLKSENLEFIVINRTGIKTIPHEIENLYQLKKLAVSNKLTYISDSIGNLSDMRYLSFGGNRSLDSIPSSIIKMKKLLHLDLSSTNIPYLPEGISELPLEKVLIYNTDCEQTKEYKILRRKLGEAFKE